MRDTEILQHFQRQGTPIQKLFANPPPISNSDNEDNLKELNKFIVNLVRNTNLKSNLTANQRAGRKSLLGKRDQLSITVSDKGGEFVVLPIRCQQDLTDHHLSNTGGVYKFVAPTRRYQGTFQPIMNPTETSYRLQISSLADRLQSKCNALWKKICSERSLGEKIERAFIATKSSLPAMYVLLRTHKFAIHEIQSSVDIVSKCKVRRIVSCCSSPTKKLAWLCTYILTLLLNVIPCHLKNIHDHLNRLSSLTPQELAHRKFCGGDISSLYTSINIEKCIEDIVALASEHKSTLCFYGLKLSDIQEVLETVLGFLFLHTTNVFLSN